MLRPEPLPNPADIRPDSMDELSRLRAGLAALCVEAEGKTHLSTGGLVSVRRLRALL